MLQISKIFAFASVFVGLLLVLEGAAQSPSMAPTSVAPQPSNQAEQNIRQARSAFFDDYIGPNKLEDNDPAAPPVITTHTPIPKSELPADLADTILVGQITNIQAYQSNNHTTIYSESTVKIEHLISQQGNAAAVGGRLEIIQDGGALMLPGGRVLTHVVKGLGNPLLLNGRYLFFLVYVPVGNCYRLVKGWLLNDGYATAVASDDLVRVRMGTSMYNGMQEAMFLQIAQKLSASYIHK